MRAKDFLNIAPFEFDNTVLKMSIHERRVLSDECEALSIAYAERAAYVAERYGHGCGDQGHKAGVKALNRIRKAIRKAFGYSNASPVNF